MNVCMKMMMPVKELSKYWWWGLMDTKKLFSLQWSLFMILKYYRLSGQCYNVSVLISTTEQWRATDPAIHNYQLFSTIKTKSQKKWPHWKQKFITDFSPSFQKHVFLIFLIQCFKKNKLFSIYFKSAKYFKWS